MKTSMILLLCAAIVLVAAEDKKGPTSVHDTKQQESHGQQHQLKQQHAQGQQHQAPGSQQHTLKHEQQQRPQPVPAHKHKREAPKNTATGQPTTAAPKETVDPKQPSVLPATVGQPPKTKRDTVAAQPAAAARPSTNAPAKAGATNQQRPSGPRPTGAKLNRDQSSNTPKSTANAKAPATVNQQSSSSTTASPAKKV
uniref:Uncharacterized protein n=1 Tax=Anopheles maculatus TaxID=74869 RepID=A0A182SV36_9DIPT